MSDATLQSITSNLDDITHQLRNLQYGANARFYPFLSRKEATVNTST
jgi:hypothetical protein